jgi:hypothetical protein
MSIQQLQYYVHSEPNVFRLELAGSLSGWGVQSVYQAWQTALSIIGDRTLVIDITFVSEADQRGRDLLLLWHQNGARIIAASSGSQALIQPIMGKPIPPQRRKRSCLQRLSAVLLGNSSGLP